MKKTKFLWVISVSLGLFACNSQEGPSVTSVQPEDKGPSKDSPASGETPLAGLVQEGEISYTVGFVTEHPTLGGLKLTPEEHEAACQEGMQNLLNDLEAALGRKINRAERKAGESQAYIWLTPDETAKVQGSSRVSWVTVTPIINPEDAKIGLPDFHGDIPLDDKPQTSIMPQRDTKVDPPPTMQLLAPPATETSTEEPSP